MSVTQLAFRSCNLCNCGLPNPIFRKNGYQLLQCSACGLVYVGNPPLPAELKKLYSFDSGYHLNFQDDDSASSRRHLVLAREYYELLKRYRAKGRLLDIGCSAGFFLKVAKDEGWETHGLEMSNDSAEIARKKYGLDVTTGTLDEVSFEPNSFDAVTIWDVIEHVENPSKVMSSINHMLKDDGIVALSTPNVDGLFPKLSFKVSNLIHHWPHPEPPHHLCQFSKKTVRELLRLTGFELLRIVDRRIPITLTFGSLKTITTSPKRFLYAAFFTPIAAVGPIVGAGDWIFVIARKARAHRR